MPRPPQLAPAVANLRPSVFASVLAQFNTLPAPPIALHLGDTWLAPPAAGRIERALARMPANGYAYANPNGLESLRAAVADRLGRAGWPGVTPAMVHPTCGATGAIAAACHTWLQAGDEVVVAAPFWPLIRGIVHSVGARPVEVPFYPRLRAGESVEAILAPHVGPRTVALYVTSPNNPCGTVLSPAERDAVAEFCVRRDLWLIADEAYHDFVYSGGPHGFLGARPELAARTATVLTTSKSYALAGLRVGFLVGDPAWVDAARRVSTHTAYNVPLIAQLAAEGALREGDSFVAEARERYAAAADHVHRHLQARFRPAEGGAYVFADVGEALGGRSLYEWLRELLREGVCVSPGDAFGADFPTSVRVCFTSVPPGEVEIAVARLNRSLDRLRRGERL